MIDLTIMYIGNLLKEIPDFSLVWSQLVKSFPNTELEVHSPLIWFYAFHVKGNLK